MIKSHTAHNTTVSLTLLCYINNERNFVFPLILIFVTQRHTIDDATIGKALLLHNDQVNHTRLRFFYL